jgi:hypothetical protein
LLYQGCGTCCIRLTHVYALPWCRLIVQGKLLLGNLAVGLGWVDCFMVLPLP